MDRFSVACLVRNRHRTSVPSHRFVQTVEPSLPQGCVDLRSFVACELNLAGSPFESSLEHGQMKSKAFIPELAFKQGQQDGVMSPCQSTLLEGRVTEGENVLQGALLSSAQFA